MHVAGRPQRRLQGLEQLPADAVGEADGDVHLSLAAGEEVGQFADRSTLRHRHLADLSDEELGAQRRLVERLAAADRLRRGPGTAADTEPCDVGPDETHRDVTRFGGEAGSRERGLVPRLHRGCAALGGVDREDLRRAPLHQPLVGDDELPRARRRGRHDRHRQLRVALVERVRVDVDAVEVLLLADVDRQRNDLDAVVLQDVGR